MAKMIITIEAIKGNELVFNSIKDAIKPQMEKLNNQYRNFVKIDCVVSD